MEPVKQGAYSRAHLEELLSEERAKTDHLKKLIAEASEYLDTNSFTNIGHGSILHRKFKEAVSQLTRY